MEKIYETNEWKLKKIMQNELQQNKAYTYGKDALNYIKSGETWLIKGLNQDLFMNDVVKITEFLIEFTSKKNIRQVEIIEDSLMSR